MPSEKNIQLTDYWILSSWSPQARRRSQSRSISVFSTTEKRSMKYGQTILGDLNPDHHLVEFLGNPSQKKAGEKKRGSSLTLLLGVLFFLVSSRIEKNWTYSEFFHLPQPTQHHVWERKENERLREGMEDCVLYYITPEAETPSCVA